MLSKQLITEFQDIMLEEYGLNLNEAEAREIAEAYTSYFAGLIRLETEKEYDYLKKP